MSSIITMTWKEMLRKRVVLMTLAMTIVFLVAYWFVARTIGTEFEFENRNLNPGSMESMLGQYMQGAIILIVGFFFSTFVVAFLAIFSSVSVIAGEAEQGVMQAMMPRPLTRTHFFIGRWIGYASMGIAYTFLLYIAVLGVTEFHSSVPGNWLTLAKAFLLFASVVPLLVAIAMLGSCYMPAMGNGVFMTMLFGAGWLGGMLSKMSGMGLFGQSEKTLQTIAGLLDMAMPADALQRRMLAEMFSLTDMQPFIDLAKPESLGPFAIASVPSNAFLLYAAGYLLIVLLLGVRAFRKKDL